MNRSSQPLYNEVQRILKETRRRPRGRRFFIFSRLIKCRCGFGLIAEQQKGHVYYRCHQRDCEIKCIREEQVREAVEKILRGLPQSELVPLAYRGFVRCADGLFEISLNSGSQDPSLSLNQVLQDILFQTKNDAPVFPS